MISENRNLNCISVAFLTLGFWWIAVPSPEASIQRSSTSLDRLQPDLPATPNPELPPSPVPSFEFPGLYATEFNFETRATGRFVPLGVPMELTPAREISEASENEKKGAAAFKVRISLPGSFGPELTAKVQVWRALPDARYLGEQELVRSCPEMVKPVGL